MRASSNLLRANQPRASRPHMPGYGIPKSKDGLLPWAWAARRLEKAHAYWLSTTCPGGRPHTMPVWCVWLEGKLFFSTGRQSRKARNLARNPRCVVCVAAGKDAVVVEGVARRMRHSSLTRRVVALYNKKYDSPIPPGEPIYGVEPQVAFGFMETDDFLRTATRWQFESRQESKGKRQK